VTADPAWSDAVDARSTWTGSAELLVLPRRRFLSAAGLFAVAAVGACSGKHAGVPDPRRTIGAAPAAPTTSSSSSTTLSTTPAGEAVDILILRTASSIEHYAAGVYTQLAGSGLVAASGISDAMRFFADHHSAHGSMFEGATGRAGGTPFTQANPELSQVVEARLHALRGEPDAVALAYSVEALAATTYAANAGQLTDPALVPLMTGIGAVEARHLAVLGTYLGGLTPAATTATPPYPAGGFLGHSGALLPGVGL
jgi:hypothetical protein